MRVHKVKTQLIVAEQWNGEHDTAVKIIKWIIEHGGSAFYCPAEQYEDKIILPEYIAVYDKDYDTQELEKGDWIVFKNDHFTVWGDEEFRQEYVV